MDIVERLRTNQCKENAGCNPPLCVCGTMDDAAEEIERLRKALKNIAIGEYISGPQAEVYKQMARAALKESK